MCQLPLLFKMFFAAGLHQVLVRFRKDANILVDIVDLEENRAGSANVVEGILYADDAGIGSRSPEGIAKIMTVIVTVCMAACSPYRVGDDN